MMPLACADCGTPMTADDLDCPVCAGVPVAATRTMPAWPEPPEPPAPSGALDTQDRPVGPVTVIRHLRYENRLEGRCGEVAPGSQVLLGRDPGLCSGAALLSDDSVSRRHATLGVSDGGEPWIRDEYSTNGSYVNNVLVPPGREVPVRHGVRLRLGEVSLLLSRIIKTPEENS